MENQRIHRHLQKKRECQCYEPAKDWNDDGSWEAPTRAHVATQVDRTVPEVSSSILVVENRQAQTTIKTCAMVSTQMEGQEHIQTATTQTANRISRITCTTQTVEQLDLHTKSVSVFSNQKECYEYWSQHREQLNHELAVAKQEIDVMLSNLVAQIDALKQSAT